MSLREGFEHPDPEEPEGFVPVVYADSEEEAERYYHVLEDHDIPAMVDEEYEPDEPDTEGNVDGRIPVLVPKAMVDDARSCLEGLEDVGAFLEEDEDAEDEDAEDEDYMLSEDDLDEDVDADEEEDDDRADG